MSSDATTLPLRDSLLGDPPSALEGSSLHEGRPARSGRLRVRAHARRQTTIGALALAVIVVCAALIVVAAADRPSFLSAPSQYGFFPHWLAGPLGGLWPSFTRSPPAIKSLFTGALVVMYVAYLVGLKYVPLLRARWAIAAVVGVHAILLLSPPLALTDVFNYINYGRMGVLHHLNPYTTVPVLEPHSDPTFYLSNWHQLLSPYGPLFTLLTYAVVPLGIAASLWTLKGLLMVASLATILLVWRCARLLGRDPVAAIVLVGLNPIVLVWGLGGAHNDFFTVFFIVLAFYLLLRVGAPGISPQRRVSVGAVASAWLALGAGVALAAAIALKASAGILVPVVLAGLLRAPRRLVQVVLGLVAGGLVLGACSVAAFGMHLPALGTQGRLVIPMSMPNVLGLTLGQGGETDTMRVLLEAALALSVLGCSMLAWRRRDALSASGWATVALLVTLSWVLPWYVLWVLPMAALSRSRALRRTALALGVYLILTWMPLATAMDNAIGIRPTKTSLGQQHQREVKRFLN
ncbi:MAG: hypothetical protein ACRDLF_08020 [Solirubrobacteraceae bacterium]